MNASKVRAALRLARFASITSVHALEAVGRKVTAGLPPADATRIISTWGAQILGTVGVEVTLSGRAPTGTTLLVANHRSYLDIALLAAHTRTLFLAKAEIGDWPLIGAGGRASQCVFVKREDAESRAYARKEIRARLDAEVSITVFPEGTTSRGPSVKPFHPGSFQVAVEAGVPVVPVSLFYPDRSMAFIDDEEFVPHFLSRLGGPIDAYISFGPEMRARDAITLRDACHGWIAADLARQEAFHLQVAEAPLRVGVGVRPSAALGAA